MIVVERSRLTPIEERPIEIVERKGIGHPDTICDSIAERISVALSKEYIKRCGVILHHNIDKLFLAAGEARQKFGGGRVIKPILLVFGDRATSRYGEEEIDVAEIAIRTAKSWIKDNLRFLDAEKHVRYQVEIKQVSANLADIFRRKSNEVLPANDTSVGVGYAPLSRTEKIVLSVEKFINSKEFKQSFPFTGEDVKVMGVRHHENLELIIALAFIDRFIESESDYFKKKEEVLQAIKEFIAKKCELKNEVKLNVLDARGRGEAGCYLTVTGTSAEGSDSGEVGRGNRVNGLIPLCRPVSNEAAAGKNPVSHVGKIYNVLSQVIAEQIYEKVSGIKEVYVWMLSEIGRPINDPALVSVELVANGVDEEMKREVEEIVRKNLNGIKEFCLKLANDEFKLYL